MGRNKKYAQTGVRVFVRYANRKLYDTHTSAYVTVSAVAKMAVGSFKVVDHVTGEDVTNSVVLSALTHHFESNPAAFESIKGELVSKFLAG